MLSSVLLFTVIIIGATCAVAAVIAVSVVFGINSSQCLILLYTAEFHISDHFLLFSYLSKCHTRWGQLGNLHYIICTNRFVTSVVNEALHRPQIVIIFSS